MLSFFSVLAFQLHFATFVFLFDLYQPLLPRYTLFYKVHECTGRADEGSVALTDLIRSYKLTCSLCNYVYKGEEIDPLGKCQIASSWLLGAQTFADVTVCLLHEFIHLAFT